MYGQESKSLYIVFRENCHGGQRTSQLGVRQGNSTLKWSEVSSGILQRSGLGPILFVEMSFVHNLPDELDSEYTA